MEIALKYRKILTQFAGFSLVGIVVTLFSIVLIFVFTQLLNFSAQLSYATAYIISIALSYVLNGKYVFKASLGILPYLMYYGIYFSGMGLGLLIIWGLKQFFAWPEFFISVAPVPVTMIWNFLFSRQLFAYYPKQ